MKVGWEDNKAPLVVCGWAGAILEVSVAFRQEQLGQKPINAEKVKV